jgi:hypothetical protein
MVGVSQLCSLLSLLLRFFVGLSDNRHHTGQDRYVIGRAAIFDDPLLEFVIRHFG